MTEFGSPVWPNNEQSNDLDREPLRSSPVSESVMTTYSDLPAEIQKHLLELEVFIGDCDGQWTALQTSDEKVVLDNGTIDASDAVKAFNGIVAALRTFAFAQTGQQQIKDAFYAGYWAWFGPASQKELDRGCSELDKSWLEYEAALADTSTIGNSK